MPTSNDTNVKENFKKSAFDELGFENDIDLLLKDIQQLYLNDTIPWVIGYSGGKDSTAVVQLIWLALRDIKPSKRMKHVYIISTDTLVENPIVSVWVTESLIKIEKSAKKQGLPISAHRLTPKISNTFWVNLIGRGYPSPRPKFRWCTSRLKIMPSSDFINNVVRENGEAIVVLGIRKTESAVRANVMKKHDMKKLRDKLTRNANLPNSLIYTPIENWSNDDVWFFLMQIQNPWGVDNRELLSMYRGATEGGECPLVVDTSTPSCGDSRFGCWVCTIVEKDKSMAAMIQNDEEKKWMLPLLELRNELDIKDDRHLRDFRRMSGHVQLFYDRPIPGPYKQVIRQRWLKRVLEIQKWIRENGPDIVRHIELISLPELREIRRIWVAEKHELEDSLPRIYEEVTGETFPGERFDDNQVFTADELNILKESCDSDELRYELIRELLDIERRYSSMNRRAGLFKAIEQAFQRSFYSDEKDASSRALRKSEALKAAQEGKYKKTSLPSN